VKHVCCTVEILSKGLLEVLDFFIKTSKVTCCLSTSDECGNNIFLWWWELECRQSSICVCFL
jgi:hypothetical protein